MSARLTASSTVGPRTGCSSKTPMNASTAGRVSTPVRWRRSIDRKSTRLNSSHDQISYAVFCLKKKKREYYRTSHYARAGRAAVGLAAGTSVYAYWIQAHWQRGSTHTDENHPCHERRVQVTSAA